MLWSAPSRFEGKTSTEGVGGHGVAFGISRTGCKENS